MHKLESEKSMMLILTTEGDHNKANKLAYVLLKNKLVACVSFNEIKSLFWWDGEITHSEEVQLFIKTKKTNYESTLEFIRRHHSYENPEIIYFHSSTNESYSKWIEDVVN